MKPTFTHLKPVSPFIVFFGITVSLFSLYIILFSNILFGFFMMAFAVYLISTEGSQINFENKTYRNIWSVFSIHFGKWKAIPKFEYISVFRGRQKQRVNSLGTSTTLTNEVFYINLFYNRNEHITFYKTLEEDDAFEIAQEFQRKLELDILDATKKESVWLN